MIREFELLPEDIKEKIYSKIIYSYPDELLEEIKTYKYKNKFIKKFNNIEDIDDKVYIFYDILVIYYIIKENKIPTSTNPDQLSLESFYKIEEIFSVNMDDNEVLEKYMIEKIKKIIKEIDNYYLEKILQ